MMANPKLQPEAAIATKKLCIENLPADVLQNIWYYAFEGTPSCRAFLDAFSYVWDGDDEVCHTYRVASRYFLVPSSARWPTCRNELCDTEIPPPPPRGGRRQRIRVFWEVVLNTGKVKRELESDQECEVCSRWTARAGEQFLWMSC